MDEHLFHEASQLENYLSNLEQNHEFLTNQIIELEQFSKNLQFLSKTSEKEMLSSLGKGVYLPAQITSKNLLVEVGAGVVIQKSPEELQKVIESQLKKLTESKIQLGAQLESYTEQLRKIMHELELQHEQDRSKTI